MRLENYKKALWGLLVIMIVLLGAFTYTSNELNNVVLKESIDNKTIKNYLLQVRRTEKDFII